MTKSLRERQLKEQILNILKTSEKPLMLLSIYGKLDKKGEKLGAFWRELLHNAESNGAQHPTRPPC